MIKNNNLSGSVACIITALFIAASAVMLTACAAFGSDETVKSHPKIGLVLGGGGARGASYVGILKVLEKERIPVDYVVGSSMGAVIGGGYSIGMSPQEIEDLLVNTDWRFLFSDKPIRQQMTFRHKEEQKELIDFELGVKKWKLVLPQGLIAGQKFDFLLESMSLPVIGINDFDKLPVPFRAIATDIETGDAVILSSGSLPQAIRASMSIPGVFSPVKIGGRILVDGGFTKTLPIDIAKQMGADVIIAVYVPEPLLKGSKLDSMIAVSSQLLNVMTQQMVRAQTDLLGAEDILIIPKMGNISTTDFGKSKEAIDLGEKAAMEIVSRLKRYSVSEEEYAAYLEGQRMGKPKPIEVDFIDIEKPARVDPRAIAAMVKTKTGTMLNLKTLQNDLSRIYEIGDFENVYFAIRKEREKTGLFIYTKDKQWGPNYLRFGLSIQDDFQGASYYNVLADFTMTQLNALGAEWKNQIQVGRTQKYFTDFYQPLDFSNTFYIDPKFRVQRAVSDIYDGSTRIAQYSVFSTEGGVEAGCNFGTYAKAALAWMIGRYNAGPLVGDTSLPTFRINQAALVPYLHYDQLDNVNFPHKGAEAAVGLFMAPASWGAVNSYNKLEIDALQAFTIGRNTILASVMAGSNLGRQIPFYDEYSLGGFLSLSGYKIDQLRGQNMGLARLIYYYRLFDGPPPWLDGVYLGGSLESGNVWPDVNTVDLRKIIFAGSVFVGMDTFLGPVYLAYGVAQKSRGGQFYLWVGKRF